MVEVSVKELRNELRHVIDQVEAGEEVTITRRGRVVARLMPPLHPLQEFPDLSGFRASIKLKGGAISETVIQQRREVRY